MSKTLLKDFKITKRQLRCLNEDCPGFLDLIEQKDYYFCEHCQDPNNEKTYYFAAQVITSEDPDDFTNFLSVYRYDIPTRHFERLFRQTYSKENPYKDSRPPNAPLPAEDYAPVFQLRGYDQGQLIFFIADSDYSPGYCFDPLLLEGSLVSLSIKSPYSGFKIYNAADDLIAKARAEEQKCRQEFESQF